VHVCATGSKGHMEAVTLLSNGTYLQIHKVSKSKISPPAETLLKITLILVSKIFIVD
jgi:hypothetical protein